MPVLVIAVVFFVIFLVMGVMGFSAMVAEHRGHVFSGHWSDGPATKYISADAKPVKAAGRLRLFGSEL